MTHLEPDQQLIDDARRWRYVRDHLARIRFTDADGDKSYEFGPLYGSTGNTIDEAVDNAIERSAMSAHELFRHFRGKDTDEEK